MSQVFGKPYKVGGGRGGGRQIGWVVEEFPMKLGEFWAARRKCKMGRVAVQYSTDSSKRLKAVMPHRMF